MMDRYLIEHCSPTLASLKTANLFNYTFSSQPELEETLLHWNACMNGKGIFLRVLRKSERKALIYVYRKKRLERDLQQPEVIRFLKNYGYQYQDVDYALERLSTRFVDGETFPHEIGIFLEYPLGDVIGFIQNRGQNCKCAGCWKVYCNESVALRTFAKYKKCRDIYTRLWNQGRSVLQLTVAV